MKTEISENELGEMYFCKAEPLTSPGFIEGISVIIDGKLPDFKDLNEAAIFYKNEGNRLAGVLGKVLPGGTIHQLLIALLRRKENYYSGTDLIPEDIGPDFKEVEEKHSLHPRKQQPSQKQMQSKISTMCQCRAPRLDFYYKSCTKCGKSVEVVR
jgi:hypothetical protein